MIPVLEGVFGVCLVGAAIVQANRQTMATHWARRYWTVGVGVAALWLVLSVVLSFAPVVRDASAVVSQLSPGAIRVSVTATKVRDCQWLKSEAYVLDSAGNLHEASLTWEGDRIKGNSKPVGRHKWEPARIEFDRDIRAAKVQILAYHSCGWMWRDTITTEGPWGVP